MCLFIPRKTKIFLQAEALACDCVEDVSLQFLSSHECSYNWMPTSWIYYCYFLLQKIPQNFFFFSRHMSKLRELHGLEILHSCVKLISWTPDHTFYNILPWPQSCFLLYSVLGVDTCLPLGKSESKWKWRRASPGCLLVFLFIKFHLRLYWFAITENQVWLEIH